MNQKKLQQLGLAVIKTERAALKELEARIEQSFVLACELIL